MIAYRSYHFRYRDSDGHVEVLKQPDVAQGVDPSFAPLAVVHVLPTETQARLYVDDVLERLAGLLEADPQPTFLRRVS